jgi:hypothetical protein
MTTDQRYLGNAQAHLEETTNSFMSQIMETKTINACFLLQTFPSQPHSIPRHFEHLLISPAQSLKCS